MVYTADWKEGISVTVKYSTRRKMNENVKIEELISM